MPLSPREHEIASHLASREEALIEDLRLHVGLPTGGNHTPALDETRALFTGRLERLGAVVEHRPGDPKPEWLRGGTTDATVPPTAVCRREGSGRRILIAGHLDTVHDPKGPFRSLEIAPDGRTATGPGCVDMKGGLVIAMAALEALHDLGVEVAWTVILNSDEETGTFHSAAHLASEAAVCDFGIALEPALAGGELAIERKGSGQFMIETTGRAAHVGRAFRDGVSAVTALGAALVEIGAEAERGTTINVGPLEGGAATNAVADRARAWGNVRFENDTEAGAIDAFLGGLERDGLPGCHVERVFNRPAKPLTPEVQAFAASARSVAEDLGQSLPFASTGGVCDGNILQASGLPTIDTLGVRGGGLHTPEEWIEMASLVERAQLLAILLARLA